MSDPHSSTLFCYFDPAGTLGHQIWLDDKGTVTELIHQPGSSDGLTFEGQWITTDGRQGPARLIYEQIKAGKVRLQFFRSADGGRSWRQVRSTILAPKRDRATAKQGVFSPPHSSRHYL